MKILKNKNISEKIMNNRKINMYEGFSTTSVSNIFKIKRGRVISQKYIENNRGEYPVYSSCASGDGAMGYINSYNESGDMITWTTDGYYAGTVFFRTGNFNCTNICGILSLKESLDSKFNLKYLSYLLKKEFPKHITKTDNRKLMSNTVENINFLYCKSLDMQNKIANTLINQENQIHKIKKLIEKIEIRNQYYADKLTIGEISIDENGKVSNLKADLANFKLSELFDFRMGQTILGKDVINKDDSEKEGDTQIPVYSATESDVPFGFINRSQVNKLLNENDIIISARGTIGFPKLNNIKQKTSTQTTIQMISKGLISSYMVKKCIDVKKDYFFASEGAAVPQLTINTLSNKIIKIVKDTSNIEIFLRKLDNEKEKVERLLKLEEQRFEWLSDKLLSGEYIIED